jgi:hypothetical protein
MFNEYSFDMYKYYNACMSPSPKSGRGIPTTIIALIYCERNMTAKALSALFPGAYTFAGAQTLEP